MNGIARTYQSSNLNWHYSSANQDEEANTADGYCDFELINSLGESASLIDNLVMNCGTGTGSGTHEETTETAAYELEVVGQFAGQAAVAWFDQEINQASATGSATSQKLFGAIAVGVNLGPGTLDVNLLSYG